MSTDISSVKALSAFGRLSLMMPAEPSGDEGQVGEKVQPGLVAWLEPRFPAG